MKMSKALALVEDFTADQWGMITTAQAVAAGVDSVTLYRLADAGRLEPIRRGVYAAAAAPVSRHRDVQAAWLTLRPAVPAWERPRLDPDGGVVSHRTAALLHEIGDMVTDAIELTVPRRRATRDSGIKLRQRALTEEDVTLVEGLPVTSLERTIVDLLAEHVDASHIAAAIKDAVHQHLDLDQLVKRMGPYARRYGVKSRDGNKLLDHLLDQIGTTRAGITRAPVGATSVATRRDMGTDTAMAHLRQALEGLGVPATALTPSVQQTLKRIGDVGVSPSVRQALEQSMKLPAAELLDLPTITGLALQQNERRQHGTRRATSTSEQDEDAE